MAPPDVLSGGKELWKKSMVCNCCSILHANTRVSPLILKLEQDLAEVPSSFLHHLLTGGGVRVEGCILFFDVFVSWAPTQNVPSLLISLTHPLQNLSALGMQTACPASIFSWWEETLSWPTALQALWGIQMSIYLNLCMNPSAEKFMKLSLGEVVLLVWAKSFWV